MPNPENAAENHTSTDRLSARLARGPGNAFPLTDPDRACVVTAWPTLPGDWLLPRFRHDVHLVAVATGPGVSALYWPVARPYQPASPEVRRRVIGSTEAVWIDGDGDGKRSCAHDYARRLVQDSGRDVAKLLAALAAHDEAVAARTAGLLHEQGVAVTEPEVLAAARKAGESVERGFQAYFAAWRECQLAQANRR